MRRTPYLDRNQKISQKYKNQFTQKKSFDWKYESNENQHQKTNLQLNQLIKKLDPDQKKSRTTPMNNKSNVEKVKNADQKISQKSKTQNLRNNFLEKNAQDDFEKKIQLINYNQIRESSHKTKKNQSQLFISSRNKKQQLNYKSRLYRGNSFKQHENPKNNSMSYDRKFTPTPNQRYEKQKLKVSKIGLNKNQEIVQKIKSPQSSRRKIFDIIERNFKPKNTKLKQKNQEQELFFQYVLRFSYRSKKGFMPNNPGKCNQDSYIISPNINKKTWQHYFGICDGHGIYGHHVSDYIKNILPNVIANTKNLEKNPKQHLHKAFQTTVKKLLKQSHIDLSFSGSTVVGCYLFQDRIFCCNVGDSRAIIGSKAAKDKKWTAKSLSVDHKPNLQKEAERIKKFKGRIQSFKDQDGNPIGPLRVWIQSQNIPGLAMTRSFGDLVAASVGVSWQPQISQFKLTQNDKIILIASDGVWQFLQNDQIINYLSPFYEKNKIQEACDFLLELADSKWKKQCSVIDDISFILIFMQYNESD